MAAVVFQLSPVRFLMAGFLHEEGGAKHSTGVFKAAYSAWARRYGNQDRSRNRIRSEIPPNCCT